MEGATDADGTAERATKGVMEGTTERVEAFECVSRSRPVRKGLNIDLRINAAIVAQKKSHNRFLKPFYQPVQ